MLRRHRAEVSLGCDSGSSTILCKALRTASTSFSPSPGSRWSYQAASLLSSRRAGVTKRIGIIAGSASTLVEFPRSRRTPNLARNHLDRLRQFAPPRMFASPRRLPISVWFSRGFRRAGQQLRTVPPLAILGRISKSLRRFVSLGLSSLFESCRKLKSNVMVRWLRIRSRSREPSASGWYETQ